MYVAMHQKRRRRSKGNEVREGIEFLAERAFLAAHAGEASVQEIEHAGEQDEKQGFVD